MSETEIPALDLAAALAGELALPRSAVARTLELFAGGATIPFVARYRKEVTGGLDEVVLGRIQERADYLGELDQRRRAVITSIAEQGKLTPELRARLLATSSKTELEDLYLPYKPRRRTRATIARERGLEPLADLIWAQGDGVATDLGKYLGPEVPDADAAWQGARDIVAERVAEDAAVRAALREHALREGAMSARQAPARKPKPGEPPVSPEDLRKFEDYFNFQEPVRTLPSHRVLALRRGEKLGALRVSLDVDREQALALARARAPRARGSLAAHLTRAIDDAYDRLLAPSIEVDVRLALKERADAEAIRVFADNLRHLLLAAPLGDKRVLALDPGFRTGCKLVVLDDKGDLLEHTVIYPHEPQKRDAEARATITQLARKHAVQAIAIGNGTAGRETETLVRGLRADLPAGCLVVSVSESGASVYSASEIAREELPDHDVTVRGAVSIGRRLQDPLAELVKIDPKSIGVGQYQHDVDQPALRRALDGVVESSVNRVGVEVNTASARLLAYVSGIGAALAKAIVAYRAAHGPFASRRALLEVPRLGAKAFEQAAGFLRVRGGKQPLDASAVHPESYDVVERMAADLGLAGGAAALIGRADALAKVPIARYVDDRCGEPTLRDILAELERPGRDPREAFEAAGFRDDITEIAHLREGMVLAGVVTNVAAFGAFVDIGVHQDGLVHVSELAHRFVKDPAEVVKVGDRVQVKVLKVETDRKRISLSIKQTTSAPQRAPQPSPKSPPQPPPKNQPFNAIKIRR